jgi:putative ABC transport system permease protein
VNEWLDFFVKAGVPAGLGVFIVMLAMAQGFRSTLVSSGSPQNALILRGGANAEMMSVVMLDQARVIADAPGVARSTACGSCRRAWS